jgi:nucleotide-binding universal stress UspA family protein
MPGIVLTTDLSPESQRAFPQVQAVAERLGLPIVLLGVIEEVPIEPSAAGLVVPIPDRAQMRRDWSERLERLARTFGSVPVRTAVLEAMDVPLAIVEFAHQERADYLAMATHGRSGLRRLLLGSVTESVLRHAHVPVIVYPPPA